MHASCREREKKEQAGAPPVPDPAAANGRRAPVGQCSADGRLSRTSGGLSAPPAAPEGDQHNHHQVDRAQQPEPKD